MARPGGGSQVAASSLRGRRPGGRREIVFYGDSVTHMVALFDGRITGVLVSKSTSGSSGSTDLDLLLDGVSIVSSLGLSVESFEEWLEFDAGVHLDENRFHRGQSFTIATLGTETVAATGVVVVLLCTVE